MVRQCKIRAAHQQTRRQTVITAGALTFSRERDQGRSHPPRSPAGATLRDIARHLGESLRQVHGAGGRRAKLHFERAALRRSCCRIENSRAPALLWIVSRALRVRSRFRWESGRRGFLSISSGTAVIVSNPSGRTRRAEREIDGRFPADKSR